MTSIAELLSDPAGSRAVVVRVTAFIVVLCVTLHYEALNVCTRLLRSMHLAPRLRVVVLISTLPILMTGRGWPAARRIKAFTRADNSDNSNGLMR